MVVFKKSTHVTVQFQADLATYCHRTYFLLESVTDNLWLFTFRCLTDPPEYEQSVPVISRKTTHSICC